MKDAGYCDGTYETLSLWAHTGLFEKLLPNVGLLLLLLLLYYIQLRNC